MKNKIMSLAILTSILLSGCGDPEAKQAEKLAFSEENYTYKETIKESSPFNYFSKEYESVLCKKGSTVPSLRVRYDVVSDVYMGNDEYWHYSEPQGVIEIKYEGEVDISDSAVNELAKPIIEHMSENGVFHPDYGLDFVKTINLYTNFYSDPLIYNNGSTEGFEIKDSGREHGYYN